MFHLLRALALSWLPFAGSASFVPPTALVDGKAEFEASFAQVQGLMDRRSWKEARTRLQDLLTAHKDQEYVRARLAEIKECLHLCSFEIAVPHKQVKDVFRARRVAWDEKKGEIELVYEKEKPSAKKAEDPKTGAGEKSAPREGASDDAFPPADFQRVEGIAFARSFDNGLQRTVCVQRTVGVLVHVLPFAGSCSIEVSGIGMGQGEPGLRVGIEGQSCLETIFPPGNAPQILQILEGEREPRSLAIQTGIVNAVLPYTLEARADKTKIEGWYNDKRVVSAKRSAGVFGQVGFRDVEGVRKIRVAGKVDPAWIEKRVAALVQADREAFDKTYDVKKDLPEWLR